MGDFPSRIPEDRDQVRPKDEGVADAHLPRKLSELFAIAGLQMEARDEVMKGLPTAPERWIKSKDVVAKQGQQQVFPRRTSTGRRVVQALWLPSLGHEPLLQAELPTILTCK